MRGSRRSSPRNSSPSHGHYDPLTPTFPLPAYLDFVPGGVDYGNKDRATANRSTPSGNATSSPFGSGTDDRSSANANWHNLNHIAPDSLVRKAVMADETLRKYALRYHASEESKSTDEAKDLPHRLPSLSVLAEASFAPLTGVHATTVKKWADAMVLTHLSKDNGNSGIGGREKMVDQILIQSEHELISEFETKLRSIEPPSPVKPPAASSHTINPNIPSPRHSNDLVHALKSMHQTYLFSGLGSGDNVCKRVTKIPKRPCGYVFRAGDIAWNCRTCQYDNTCVLCDSCFQASDHEGHDVTFHKTSPGGCCDCGDLEAWKKEGCCPLHRPDDDSDDEEDSDANVEENKSMEGDGTSGPSGSDNAFKAARKSRKDGEAYVAEMLPPKFAAALGVVIGAAVKTIVQAADGSSIGADPVQWTRRWADQMRRVHDGRSVDEEYVLSDMNSMSNINSSHKSVAATVGEAMKLSCPNRFRLHLRLHNDDVHTYDEVIEALWGSHHHIVRGGLRPEVSMDERDTAQGLVANKSVATDKTQLVDNEGQVIVKDYTTMKGAVAGFNRLKDHGLQSSVVSTPQIELEHRARMLTSWLSEIAAAHPAVSALVVHALVDVTEGADPFGSTFVWGDAKMVPSWSFSEGHLSSARVAIHEEEEDDQFNVPGWRRRLDVFLPHLASSFLTREESRQLHKLGFVSQHDLSSPSKGVDLDFYSKVPYMLQSERYRKSAHSLWGVMPSPFAKSKKYVHPVLSRDSSTAPKSHHLVDSLIVLDTDLRKQQEAEMLTKTVHTHKLLGLHMISGVGLVDVDGDRNGGSAMKPTAEDWRRLLSISSYRAPISPILLLLLLDPYPTKQLRVSIHQLFLSMMVDSRLKARFAASLGGIAYRSLTTLFCAGIGTEGDTPLHFTVQIFTAGSIVRALCDSSSIKKLLINDGDNDIDDGSGGRGVFCLPLAHNIARCIHTNLLGACEEVRMVLNHTDAGQITNINSAPSPTLKALIYQHGEQPLNTLLPAAPDDGFLDCRSTKHKRLPHLLRDLEYVLETPGTAMHLLRTNPDNGINGANNAIDFATIWCRLLRLAQGMDPQKRKISGGHVEFEKLRWLEAFSLSLHFSGARDKLTESLPSSAGSSAPPLESMLEAMGNLSTALLREMKWWLYREGVLVALPPTAPQSIEADKMDALQRSTLHVNTSSLGVASIPSEDGNKTPALSCATQTKMTESHLEIIETAIQIEQSQHRLSGSGRGTIAGDWLRVPHSPHAGDCLSFHLPLHRSLARNILASCSLVVTEEVRNVSSLWWQLPALDDNISKSDEDFSASFDHPLCTLLRPTLRSLNCRITWSAGPDCTTEEAQRRRSRSRAISSAIASAKVIHSLCDHPLRCLAAAEQISRHLWARNGSTATGMALNYSTTPLCKSFRDLDLTMVQLSASGFSIGLGARRVFTLLLNRFNLENFLCDLERRSGNKSPTNGTKGSGSIDWVMKQRLQDPDHAEVLMEAFFSTMCVLVTELPPPPPTSTSDTTATKTSVRRELLHALSTSSLTYSKAMDEASTALSKMDASAASGPMDGDSASFRSVFESVLQNISEQKSQGPRGAPKFTLKCDVSDDYDPCFFHLKRSEHQQAMDNIANLRKQKCTKRGKGCCLPIVTAPSSAHPRFMPCRLLLHLPILDAGIRRALMFALTGGKWVPPSAPSEIEDDIISLSSPSFASELSGSDGKTIKVRANPSRRARLEEERKEEFSEKTVKNSSNSFLEVLQLLTLQVHTLEECAYMHISHPNLDHENKSLSASLSINSYLNRLVHVPSSLNDVWAFRNAPDGPLSSKGSGLNKASILGLLIALYEFRSDNGANSNSSSGHGDEDAGGARYLVANGLKWLLRFVCALVDGAESVSEAYKSATDGIPLNKSLKNADINRRTSWTIDESLQSSVLGMLTNLPELWPSGESSDVNAEIDKTSAKHREARKIAQKKVMERMKKMQSKFADSIAAKENINIADLASTVNKEADLCIICRCDDEDGENNGPLGYLGHVQRSRSLQLRSHVECCDSSSNASKTYRVVGDKGCQIRENVSLDSTPVACIPAGSIVEAKDAVVSPKYDIQTRRVFIRHVSQEDDSKVVEGWASIQSTQGYKILDPVLNMCYKNSRWGATRPLIRQCGHAAHLKCVEIHVASIHQKAQAETPYDGRYAADIEDGEFLCPLCKQLCNVVVPAEASQNHQNKQQQHTMLPTKNTLSAQLEGLHESLTAHSGKKAHNEESIKAIKQYGNYLEHSMQVFSWDPNQEHKRQGQENWHDAVKKWDYIENEDHAFFDRDFQNDDPYVSDILRLLRQQHIAWAAAGHTAAAAEAASRGLKKSGFEPPTCDPWEDYDSTSRDSHSMVVELSRTLTAASCLQMILSDEINEKLERTECKEEFSKISIIGYLLGNIVKGMHWTSTPESIKDSDKEWKVVSALLAALPCHVSRDESLALRQEARATAAQAWVVNAQRPSDAKQASHDSETDVTTDLPLAPLCIRKIPGHEALRNGWGSMRPSDVRKGDQLPFRPAVATGFLYMPLLSWDLTTFAGAIFSSLLSSENTEIQDLFDAARFLLTARLVQCLVTFEGAGNIDSIGIPPFEAEIDVSKESLSVVDLLNYLNRSNSKSVSHGDDSDRRILAYASYSILPFARTLVLLLRASTSTIRQRAKDINNARQELLESEDTMYIEDGFYFTLELGCPMPSDIMLSLSSKDSTNPSVDWPKLINLWLTAVQSLDTYQGSQGDHLEYDSDSKQWKPKIVSRVGKIEKVSLKAEEHIGDYEEIGNPSFSNEMEMSMHSINDEDDDEMMDEESEVADEGFIPRVFGTINGIDSALEGDDSSDEEMEHVAEAFEDVGEFFGITSFPTQSGDIVESNDSEKSQYSWDDFEDSNSLNGDESRKKKIDELYANVSTSAIIPFQSGFLGIKEPGPGPRGGALDYKTASPIMRDASHLGLIHRPVTESQGSGLIRLPSSFVELYSLVNKLRAIGGNDLADDNDESGPGETAICLVTGATIRSGSNRRYRQGMRSVRAPGACTLHARNVGSGTGIFFLPQKCTVLLIHNKKSAYWASLYVDENGEEDPNLHRGRPLFLKKERYEALATLWREHGIPGEVAQIRSTSDRVIRDNWY